MEGKSSIHPQTRQRRENETRWGNLLDLDVLDCPICFEPLTIPTFQCDDGHLLCIFCFDKANNKCPGHGCDLPMGNKRCFAMEKVLKSTLVPCKNAETGCTNFSPYVKASSHEKECIFSLCSCPNLACDYTGSYKSMYRHFESSHVDVLYNPVMYFPTIWCDTSLDVTINTNDKVLVLWEPSEESLIVVQCLRERHGVYVTVGRIAPPILEFEKFSYRLSCNVDGEKISHESPQVKRFIEVISQTPDKNFMCVPVSSLCGDMLKMKLCIKKLSED